MSEHKERNEMKRLMEKKKTDLEYFSASVPAFMYTALHFFFLLMSYTYIYGNILLHLHGRYG